MKRRVVPLWVVSFSVWRVAGFGVVLVLDLDLGFLDLSISLLLWYPLAVCGGSVWCLVRVNSFLSYGGSGGPAWEELALH